MNLYASTYILAAVFAVAAFALFARPDAARKCAMRFLRSKTASYVTFGAATLWFVYLLSQLGEADFGDIKGILIVLFGGAGLLAFKYLPDFLSVRGAAIIALLSCRAFIDSAFMQEPPSRLLLVSVSYLIVVFALYIGTLPYRMRDILEWIFASGRRTKACAALFAALFAALICASLMY